jgi:hypothetical protein
MSINSSQRMNVNNQHLFSTEGSSMITSPFALNSSQSGSTQFIPLFISNPFAFFGAAVHSQLKPGPRKLLPRPVSNAGNISASNSSIIPVSNNAAAVITSLTRGDTESSSSSNLLIVDRSSASEQHENRTQSVHTSATKGGPTPIIQEYHLYNKL